jgi:hypothetical protein
MNPDYSATSISAEVKREHCSESLVSIWKLLKARTFDDADQELPPLGPHPIGTVIFQG